MRNVRNEGGGGLRRSLEWNMKRGAKGKARWGRDGEEGKGGVGVGEGGIDYEKGKGRSEGRKGLM